MVAATVLALASLTVPKEGVESHAAQGIRSIAFARKEGVVRVYLPADIRPGDTITGTVVSEPTGTTDKELSHNASVLNGLVVDVQGQGKPGPGRLKFVLPASGLGLLPILLKNTQGKTLSKFQAPTLSNTEPIPAPPSLGPENFCIPPISQAGNFLPIQGAFDGDVGNTSVKIGDLTCPVYVESPRTCVAVAPKGLTGKQNLELKERGFTSVAPVQNVKVSLSAPKTTLLKGESTTVKVMVSGLDDLDEGVYPIPFQWTNLSPGHISLGAGATTSTVLIDLQAVKSGAWTSDVPITATVDGEFQVQGTVYFDFNDDRKAKLPASAVNAWIRHIIADFEAEIKVKEGDKSKATRVELLRKVVSNLKSVRVTDNNQLERGATLRAVDAQLNLITALDVGVALVDVAADLLGYKDLPMATVFELLSALKDQNAIGNGDLLQKAMGLSAVYQTINDAKSKLETLGKLKDAIKELQDNLKRQMAN